MEAQLELERLRRVVESQKKQIQDYVRNRRCLNANLLQQRDSGPSRSKKELSSKSTNTSQTSPSPRSAKQNNGNATWSWNGSPINSAPSSDTARHNATSTKQVEWKTSKNNGQDKTRHGGNTVSVASYDASLLQLIRDIERTV